jgi:anti-sigma B factor antagonist
MLERFTAMRIKIEQRELRDSVTVIQISGRIALGRESDNINPEIAAAIEQGARKVIVDLSGVTHIDSTGIGIVAYCFGQTTQAGAEFRIAGAKANILDLFKITRLIHVVPFFPDVDSAIRGSGRLS